MYVCMCVRMYVCMCMCVSVCVHVFLVSVSAFPSTCKSVYVYIYMLVCEHLQGHVPRLWIPSRWFFEVLKFHKFCRCWSFAKFNPFKKWLLQIIACFSRPIRENKIVKELKICHSHNLSDYTLVYWYVKPCNQFICMKPFNQQALYEAVQLTVSLHIHVMYGKSNVHDVQSLLHRTSVHAWTTSYGKAFPFN